MCVCVCVCAHMLCMHASKPERAPHYDLRSVHVRLSKKRTHLIILSEAKPLCVNTNYDVIEALIRINFLIGKVSLCMYDVQ